MAQRTISSVFLALAGAVVILAASGCGKSFQIPTAPGFVKLEDQEPAYDYRATTADGVVIGVREIKHEPKGDNAFWVQAIKNQMRAMAGYALLDTVQVSTKSGLKGTQLRFGHDEKGEPLLYSVTVFVTDKYIYVVEFGGTKQQMDQQATQLTWVLENFNGG
jgi:hypothetical protein